MTKEFIMAEFEERIAFEELRKKELKGTQVNYTWPGTMDYNDGWFCSGRTIVNKTFEIKKRKGESTKYDSSMLEKVKFDNLSSITEDFIYCMMFEDVAFFYHIDTTKYYYSKPVLCNISSVQPWKGKKLKDTIFLNYEDAFTTASTKTLDWGKIKSKAIKKTNKYIEQYK